MFVNAVFSVPVISLQPNCVDTGTVTNGQTKGKVGIYIYIYYMYCTDSNLIAT